ncbi:MAG: DUF2071 domain-containing protein [Actinomycetota bacterium]|nr:DUF2071 domain-containing protein [Actinomycetota bacterium]
MRLPSVEGTIDRRLLVNFAVDPEILERLLPPPFRPKLLHGQGVAGICLIRLRDMRPTGFPALAGVRSENAAHRIAVVWDDDGCEREGVFIPRRDTSSRLNTVLGGRVFPGVHNHARFRVAETHEGRINIDLKSYDRRVRVLVGGRISHSWPGGSVFASLDEASRFFSAGSHGYSAAAGSEALDGLELRTKTWDVQPFEVQVVESSFFDDRSLFPRGTTRFDNALVMKGIAHEWRPLEPLHTGVAASAAPVERCIPA